MFYFIGIKLPDIRKIVFMPRILYDSKTIGSWRVVALCLKTGFGLYNVIVLWQEVLFAWF